MENDIKSILLGLRHIATKLDKLSTVEKPITPVINIDWKSQSDELGTFSTAFSAFQGEVPDISADDSGFKGKFLSLSGMINQVREPLRKNNLSFTQEITEFDSRPYIVTVVRHGSGQWIRSKTPLYFIQRSEIKTGQDFHQECGKTISYMRRYALESILGIKGGDREDYDR